MYTQTRTCMPLMNTLPFPMATFSAHTHAISNCSLSALNFSSVLFGNKMVIILFSMIGWTDMMLLTSIVLTLNTLGLTICNLDFSLGSTPTYMKTESTCMCCIKVTN